MLPLNEGVIPAGRIAVLGCVYGNLRAFRACLADARSQGCAAVLAAGDMIGFCGASGAAVELVRENCDAWVQGNHEAEAAAGSSACGCGHADPADEALSCAASAMQFDGLDAADQEVMTGLPQLLALRGPAGAILLAHGSPDRQNEFLHAQTIDPRRAAAWLDAAGARILAVSHSGLPWAVPLPGSRLAVNCGAVGKPDHDGDPCVHYAVVELGANAPRAWIRRVAYDHAAAAADVVARGGDPRFAAVLRTGIWGWGIGSLPPAERDRPDRGPSFAVATAAWEAA